MFPIVHYIKGVVKNIFNPRISLLSIISANAHVDKTAYIYRFVKVKGTIIGAHTYIASNSETENSEIGRYCSIADHCRIGLSNHSLQYVSTSPIFTQKINGLQDRWIDRDIFEHKDQEERVYIGNDVWVGSHALICGGVHVGNGACIAAGAVVVKDVPPYSIVGGVPAKVIRYRFTQDVIAKLEEIKWWDMPEDKLRENIHFFQKEDISVNELDLFFKRLNDVQN